MKRQIVLIIGIALLLASCGKSNENEYAMARLADMITVYWVLPAHSEIANFELTDNVLELEIDMGDIAEKNGHRILKKKELLIPIGAWQVSSSLAIAGNWETLELKGMSRLDELAIFHIEVHPMMESTSKMRFKTHIMWKWIDGEWRESPQIVPFKGIYVSSRPERYLRNLGEKSSGRFEAAETFRSGDRITAYWHSPGKPTKWSNLAHAERGYIGGGISEKGLRLPDNWIQRMSIADVKPHENITCIGVGKTPEIFIAYFRVSSNATD
ncbi:hypothetical protein F4Y59_07495 [Candidatus Poribacteria bacterium]|nr:hypothetical protein [Candidatus Poribacteria bacterium]MYK18365.1 hypothetical protein [Candidatus Poribacteria bacterium]